MPRFRKKPVVIEAEQWWPGKDTESATIYSLTSDVVPQSARDDAKTAGFNYYETGWLWTLEGGHLVSPGDWIITGVSGEKYPCKPDIFEKTYEPAE